MMLSNARIQLKELKKILKSFANHEKAKNYRVFFKNSQQDTFLGISAPVISKIAKEYYQITLKDVQSLLKSNVHDERSLANKILCLKYKKGDAETQDQIFKFYLKNKNCIRDWDGVDDSAPYIVGPYLLNRDKDILYTLVMSKRIWDRRIAIVATWHFIRNGQLTDTLKLAKILLQDQEDLIHKAVGWMLREVGKKDDAVLRKFLNKHHQIMPRTMLRYAIERFSPEERKHYLMKT